MLADAAKKTVPDWLHNNVFEFIDEDVISIIYDSNKKIKEEGQHPWPYIMVFDDVLCDVALSQKRSYMSRIATTGRHFCISTVISA